MLKTVMRETSWRSRQNGPASPFVVWAYRYGRGLLAAFVFLCVAAYDWLALRYDSVIAGLIMTGDLSSRLR